jgi:MFS family permease
MASTHSTITSAFHSSELASWLSTSFLLTSTGFQPLYGRISDVVGRRLPYVFACFIFTAATLWCAMAQSMSSLVAARAVCGLGAGGMTSMGSVPTKNDNLFLQRITNMILGSILLSDILPIEVRGRYQSIYNLGWGVGSVLGAASGGFLADVLGWRWEFGIQVPFGVFCMAILYFTIPNSGDDNPCYFFDIHERFKNFDFKGSIFLVRIV